MNITSYEEVIDILHEQVTDTPIEKCSELVCAFCKDDLFFLKEILELISESMYDISTKKYDEGFEDGHTKGYDEGYEEGEEAAKDHIRSCL